MAISAATSAMRLTRGGSTAKSLFEDGKAATTSSSTWNQGELICMDSSGHYLRRVAATTDADTLVGMSDNVIISGKLAGPYDGLTAVDAAQVSPGFVGPKYGATAQVTLNTGDTVTPGAKLYLVDGADTATVSVTDGGGSGHTGSYVGIYLGSGVTSAAAGTQIPMLVGARWPNGTGTAALF